MSYRLKPPETLPESVKRIAHEQIESAIDVLSQSSYGNRDKAVHKARKHFKKVRSLVRLVRHDIGEKTYKRENHCFRDLGHQLETLRDAQVRLETLDDLLKHYGESIETEAFDSIRQVLLEEYTAVHEDSTDGSDLTTTVIPTLQRAARRVDTWDLSDRWSAVKGGLYERYDKGCRALADVDDNPSPENLHDWRKRVKDLWYHLRLLTPLWPSMVKPWKTEVKTLSDLLGDDHDLAVLRDHLMQDPTQFNDEADQFGVLLSLIRRRQLELQTEAIFLGKRIYAESPKAFVKRMKSYWRVWRAEQEQPDVALPNPADIQHELPTIST